MTESHADKKARIEREDEAEQRRLIREAIDGMTPEQRAAAGVESLAIEGAGIKAKVTGDRLVYVLLCLLVAAALSYLIIEHDKSTRAEMVKNSSAIDRMADRMEENTYVNTLTEDKKKALNLDMPESLRKRTGRDPR